MANLVLLRHAQTDSNIAGPSPRMSGWTDLPINATGQQQLERLRRRFAEEGGIAAIYSSPLQRTRATAEAIRDATGREITFLADLREIHCGEVDGELIAAVKQKFAELWERNLRQDDDEFRWPGGESYREFRERCLRAIDTIAAAHPEGRAVIVTHAGVITQVLGAVHGLRPARWEPFRPENTSLTEIRWSRGAGELVSFNDHRHLTMW